MPKRYTGQARISNEQNFLYKSAFGTKKMGFLPSREPSNLLDFVSIKKLKECEIHTYTTIPLTRFHIQIDLLFFIRLFNFMDKRYIRYK